MRAALVGYGWWGRHIAKALAGHPRIALTGVVAPELAGQGEVDGLPVYPSYEAALADPSCEAVILTSPNALHAPQTLAAAEAGKHVFCEKPLALGAASARAMTEAMSSRGLVLGIGHERRFEPGMLRLAGMVAGGDLGTVMHAEAAFSHDKLVGLGPDNWRTRKESAPAAGMTGMGIHLTDAFIGMFGRVALVQALTADRVLGWETGDLVTVQLGFEAGMTATLSAILATPHFIRMHVFGARAWAELRNDTHPDTPGGQAHLVVSRTGAAAETASFDWSDTVTANLVAFADAVEGGAPYPIPIGDMLHNIEVLAAIAKAAECRETVRL